MKKLSLSAKLTLIGLIVTLPTVLTIPYMSCKKALSLQQAGKITQTEA